jgi:Sulfatase
MKKIFLFAIGFILMSNVFAQKKDTATNLIIITTDGFRWQDLFLGIDTGIANQKKYNEDDSIGIYKKYAQQPVMPFVSNYIGNNGQLWGHRLYECHGTVANKYWFSYPGYSELLCGYVDDSVNSNSYKHNPNTTLFDFLQKQPAYKNRIAAFGAWNAFDRILNEPRAGFPVFNGFDEYKNKKSTAAAIINKLNKEAYKPWDDDECLDVFTHNMAIDYLKTQKPKALYISYGETDEWAHAGKYKSYLNAAHQVDQYIKEIWNFVQNDPQYKNNTVLLITVDHGRGLGDEWTSHNNKINRSYETWFALLGKNVPSKGIVKNTRFEQRQLAQTVANLLGLNFTAAHAVAPALDIKNLNW